MTSETSGNLNICGFRVREIRNGQSRCAFSTQWIWTLVKKCWRRHRTCLSGRAHPHRMFNTLCVPLRDSPCVIIPLLCRGENVCRHRDSGCMLTSMRVHTWSAGIVALVRGSRQGRPDDQAFDNIIGHLQDIVMGANRRIACTLLAHSAQCTSVVLQCTCQSVFGTLKTHTSFVPPVLTALADPAFQQARDDFVARHKVSASSWQYMVCL